jgi:pyridoxal phosphate enzyme (YggS family)
MQNDLSHISQNLAVIRQNVKDAALRVGRDPSKITIVAVTKTVDVDAVLEAVKNGVTVVGESRIQEAARKRRYIGDAVEWHFIGPLQKNKAKFIPGAFKLVHSVDSYELAAELGRRAGMAGETVRILLEINVGEEKSKHGAPPLLAVDECKKIAGVENIRLSGLMAIPPPEDDPEKCRPYFKRVVEIKNELDRLKLENSDFDILSFGMTDDYMVATEEGATHLRIGRGIFGER